MLRASLLAGGLVATAAGLDAVLRGARAVPGLGENAGPVLESELRFFAAFYAAYGLAMLSIAPRAEEHPEAVHGVSGALFLAGLGRLAGWRAVGRPNGAQLGLLALELGLPPIFVAQARR